MRSGHGWKCVKLDKVPPLKDTWNPGWHSVRHHLDIHAFGINAVTSKKEGDVMIPMHNEKDSNQQEVFFVHAGTVEFEIDGERCEAEAGEFVAIEPACERTAKAIKHPSHMVIIGAPLGEIYQPPNWEKID